MQYQKTRKVMTTELLCQIKWEERSKSIDIDNLFLNKSGHNDLSFLPPYKLIFSRMIYWLHWFILIVLFLWKLLIFLLRWHCQLIIRMKLKMTLLFLYPSNPFTTMITMPIHHSPGPVWLVVRLTSRPNTCAGIKAATCDTVSVVKFWMVIIYCTPLIREDEDFAREDSAYVLISRCGGHLR